MQKQVWILYQRESNLKMKSEQTPLPSENVVRWNDLYPVFLLFFNIINIVLISLNTKISAEILVLMSVDLLKCRVFLLLLLLLQHCCYAEAEFRLDFHSANWNPYNEEGLNKVIVFQHAEKLILTLWM